MPATTGPRLKSVGEADSPAQLGRCRIDFHAAVAHKTRDRSARGAVRIGGSLALLSVSCWAQTFEASAPDRLRISAPAYELELSKSNGAILSIRDPAANLTLTTGSRNACLWGSNYQPSSIPYKGGCSFRSGGADSFEYRWDAEGKTLVLSYVSAAASTPRVDATVTIAFTPGYFDLTAAVVNRSGAILSTVLFPSDLVFENASIEAAYLPFYLPGVKLTKAYFASPRNQDMVYPGARSFADFRSFDIGPGNLSWYIVNPSGGVAPVSWGLRNDAQNKAGTFYVFHNFQTWHADGATFQSPAVRFLVGQTADQAILRYRADNGIAGYPPLAAKLGASFDLMAASPLVKMDLRWIASAANPSWASLAERLSLVRSPALLHPVSYWPLGFDRYYPDFLPPDPRFGTNQDFAGFVRAAAVAGMLVMPYSNPTWWDTESPTARSLGLAPAALDRNGNPIYESYGPNRGFVASPDAPATQQRLRELMKQWEEEVPVDLVFHDQIGSRSAVLDFNAGAPGPLHYSEAWLAFTRTYAGRRLMTEDGWDRLAETEVGFAGSALTGAGVFEPGNIRWGRESRANAQFGAGLWEPYPLGVFLFHDKVLLYHHDLDGPPMESGAEVLTWNALFGVMAGYLWPEGHRPLNPEWPAIAAAFQPAVLSRMAGKSLASYERLAPDVYQSRFDGVVSVANWMPGRTYSVDGHTIAPSGCLVRTDDRSLVAGIFTDQFNGWPLSAGTHYLIVEDTGTAVTIRQPSGPDTELAVALPAAWSSSAALQMRAISPAGRAVADVPVSLAAGQARFLYSRTLAGVLVDSYELRALAASPAAISAVRTASGGPEIAQNTWIEIHGTNLAPDGLPDGGADWSGSPELVSGRMPVALRGVSVTVNGKAAYVYYVSKTQLNVLTPLDGAAGPVSVVVVNGASTSLPFTATMRASAPSFPLVGKSSYVAGTHADGSLIGPVALGFTPARRGETVVLYAFGLGLPTAPLAGGSAAQSGVLPTLPVIQIGGAEAEVTYAGLSGPGLYQVNVVIPEAASSGDNAVSLRYNGFGTPAGSLLAVAP